MKRNVQHMWAAQAHQPIVIYARMQSADVLISNYDAEVRAPAIGPEFRPLESQSR